MAVRRSSTFSLLSFLLLSAMAPRLTAQATWQEVPELTDRALHAMAYDPVRQRVVMFGGLQHQEGLLSEPKAALGDTWEWDGKKWFRRHPRTSPSPRMGAGMAFDPVRKKILLFGGARGGASTSGMLSDTWEWDGQDWKQLFPKNSPSARWYMQMAWDKGNKNILLFGGGLSFKTIGGFRPQNDSWLWDGKNWSQVLTKTVPPARVGGGLAHCQRSNKLVLFGGGTGWGLVPNDTWEWSGNDWILKKVLAPTRRGLHGMASVPGRGTVVIHGGETDFKSVGDETWEWDGQKWQQLKPLAKPGLRLDSRLVSFDARQEVVLFGNGVGHGTTHLRDTWVWRPALGNWFKVDEWKLPLTQFMGGAVYDAARDQFVLLRNGPNIYERRPTHTWVQDEDGRYREILTKNAPHDRWRSQLVYHPKLRKVFFWGGDDAATRFTDTWLWDGKTWTRLKGPETSSSGALAYDSRRNVMVAQLVNGETWEWDEKNAWQQRHPKTQTGWKSLGSFAYDVRRGRCVIYYGTYTSCETWEWDGKDWQQSPAKTQPPVVQLPLMEYMPALGGMVLFSGMAKKAKSLAANPDTWFYNGKDWRKLSVNPFPTVNFPAIWSTYDSGRQRIRAYFLDSNGRKPASGSWDFLVKSLTTSQHHPRPGQSFSLQVNLPSQAGNPFVLGLSLSAKPGIPLRIVPGVGVELLPLAMDPLLMLSLQAGLVTLLDAQGKSTLPLGIPNDSAFLWLPFHAAGFTVTKGLGIGAITNRVGMEVVK